MSKVQPSKCIKWEILYKNRTKQLLQKEKFLHKNIIRRKIILMGVLAELQESHLLHKKTLHLGNTVTM